jgi:hypothetical protein
LWRIIYNVALNPDKATHFKIEGLISHLNETYFRLTVENKQLECEALSEVTSDKASEELIASTSRTYSAERHIRENFQSGVICALQF